MAVRLPQCLQRLRIPAVAAPLFIVSNPKLVIAQCCSGIVGSFPALNARPKEHLDLWLQEITEGIDRHNQKNPDKPAAPFAVNQIVHKSNDRLMHDMEVCVKHKAPIVITSLGARTDVNEAVHSYGGVVFHDIINNKFAKKAVEKGADGLIAVASGAGGHAGTLSPFGLVSSLREWYNGPILLSGSIGTGSSVLAAQAMGADLAYIGSLFIATHEANASDEYKQGVVEGTCEDIIYSNYFTGVHGNYLGRSIANAGFDLNNLPVADPTKMNFGSEQNDSKAWKDIWGCGQGIDSVKEVTSAAALVDRLHSEYVAAKEKIAAM